MFIIYIDRVHVSLLTFACQAQIPFTDRDILKKTNLSVRKLQLHVNNQAYGIS